MLQPFKHITVVMKDKTNNGVTALHNEATDYVDRYELSNDHRGYPVTLNNDGLGEIFTTENKGNHATIGVLLESFNKPLAQHKVAVHGIVPMRAKDDVKAGMYVFWDVANNQLVKDKVTSSGNETPYVGRALTSAKVNNSIIDVLID